MSRFQTTAISLLVALTVTAISFVLVEMIALQLIILRFIAPNDPSSGDGAGWGFIILQPIIILVDILISLVIGGVAYRLSFTKLGRAAKSAGQLSN